MLKPWPIFKVSSPENQEAEHAEQYQEAKQDREDAIGAEHGTSKMPNMDTITT